jgi:hypothetical protein
MIAMNSFTEKFLDNLFFMWKAMFLYFGVLSFPLWMIKMGATQDWISLGLLTFSPIMVVGFAFFVTFQQYKDKKEV